MTHDNAAARSRLDRVYWNQSGAARRCGSAGGGGCAVPLGHRSWHARCRTLYGPSVFTGQ
eukprot:2711477-Pyramimonas_sp.AAC.1